MNAYRRKLLREEEERRALEYKELRADLAKNERELRESEIKLAESRGRMAGLVQATHDAMRSDPQMIECLRAKAWAQSGATVGYDGGFTMPPGWPEGVNRQQFVDEWVDQRRDQALERIEGGERITAEDDVDSSESVQKLRAMLATPQPRLVTPAERSA